MEETSRGPVRWLIAANLVWFTGGILAYHTAATLVVATAVALVPALPGILELRRQATGKGLDQALAAAIGTWTVMAVLVLIPYIASEEGLTLWSSIGFQGTGLAAASLGFLLWNAAAAGALGIPLRTRRPVMALHLVALAVALYLLPADGTVREVALRGDPYMLVDLQTAPLVAALPGLLWAALLPRRPPTALHANQEPADRAPAQTAPGSEEAAVATGPAVGAGMAQEPNTRGQEDEPPQRENEPSR